MISLPVRPELDHRGEHTLTLIFGRILSQPEWRAVIEAVRSSVPHIQKLRADFIPPPADTRLQDEALRKPTP